MVDAAWAYSVQDFRDLGNVDYMAIQSAWADESSCIQWCMDIGILKSSANCRCGSPMTLYLHPAKPSRWRCNKRVCRLERRVRDGSFFAKSKLPIRKLVRFLFYYCSEVSPKVIGQMLKISDSTITDWCNFIREVCSRELLRCPMEIGLSIFVVTVVIYVFYL
jgi:hypothetical protein